MDAPKPVYNTLLELVRELGVGYNTPGIIKYPFWKFTADNPDAIYACINYKEAVCPDDIRDQSICIDGEIGKVLEDIKNGKADPS